MNYHQKLFDDVYKFCQNHFLAKEEYNQKGKFNLVSKHYVRLFLSHQIISKEMNSFKNIFDLQIFLKNLIEFFTNNQSKLSRNDLGWLFIYNWQEITPSLLYDFCKITNIYIGDIQTHIFPEIRKKIQILLNQSEFDLSGCVLEIYRLHILLKYCNINTSGYLEDWFKINQPWEGEECLQNPIAQKNIRLLLKNIKKN
jgi:hypothetical protein